MMLQTISSATADLKPTENAGGFSAACAILLLNSAGILCFSSSASRLLSLLFKEDNASFICAAEISGSLKREPPAR